MQTVSMVAALAFDGLLTMDEPSREPDQSLQGIKSIWINDGRGLMLFGIQACLAE